MSAPLTSKARGSTRCVECSKRFVDGDDVVETESEESDGWGRTSSGAAYRRLGFHRVTRRWHRVCLESVEAFIAKVRDDEVDNRAAMVAEIAREMTAEKVAATLAGMEPDFAARVRRHLEAASP